MKRLKAKPVMRRVALPAGFPEACHAQLDRMLAMRPASIVMHAEVGKNIHTMSVPQSDALAEGIMMKVASAWFQ